MIHYLCPSCAEPLDAPESEAGMLLTCPKCQHPGQVPAPFHRPPKPQASAKLPGQFVIDLCTAAGVVIICFGVAACILGLIRTAASSGQKDTPMIVASIAMPIVAAFLALPFLAVAALLTHTTRIVRAVEQLVTRP